MSDQTSAGQSGSFSDPPAPATPQQPVARLAQPAAPPSSAPTGAGGGPGGPATEPPDEEKETRWWAWILAILLLLLLLGAGLWYFFGRETTPTPSPTTAAPPITTGPPVTQPPVTTPPVTPSVTLGTIAVPDIIGKTAQEADQILRDAGFTKVTFSSGDPNVPVQVLDEWKVTGQNPAAGSAVTPDTEIVITVEKIGGGGKG